jgi:hypothetical protein
LSPELCTVKFGRRDLVYRLLLHLPPMTPHSAPGLEGRAPTLDAAELATTVLR